MNNLEVFGVVPKICFSVGFQHLIICFNFYVDSTLTPTTALILIQNNSKRVQEKINIRIENE